jgi:hypothetical protein
MPASLHGVQACEHPHKDTHDGNRSALEDARLRLLELGAGGAPVPRRQQSSNLLALSIAENAGLARPMLQFEPYCQPRQQLLPHQHLRLGAQEACNRRDGSRRAMPRCRVTRPLAAPLHEVHPVERRLDRCAASVTASSVQPIRSVHNCKLCTRGIRSPGSG